MKLNINMKTPPLLWLKITPSVWDVSCTHPLQTRAHTHRHTHRHTHTHTHTHTHRQTHTYKIERAACRERVDLCVRALVNTSWSADVRSSALSPHKHAHTHTHTHTDTHTHTHTHTHTDRQTHT